MRNIYRSNGKLCYLSAEHWLFKLIYEAVLMSILISANNELGNAPAAVRTAIHVFLVLKIMGISLWFGLFAFAEERY